jgi:ParB family chromosome partitioning protein
MEAKKSATAVEAKPARRLGRGLSSLMALNTPVHNTNPPPQVIINSEPMRVPSMPEKGVRAEAASATSVGAVQANGLSDFQSVAVGLISPSRYQPRKTMDEGAIARLADSIKRSGLMQPVIVRPVGAGKYELVAGERRWRAAQAAGLAAVPALVRPMGDEQAAEWGLVENVQREDLNPMERAWALKALADKFALQQAQLAERVGLERSTIANLMRLCELEAEIAQMIVKGELSAGHGKALLALPAGQSRVDLAKRVVAEGISVRKVEQLAAAAVGEESSNAKPANPLDEFAARMAGLRDLERQIGQQLGTKVAIRTDRRGKRGKLTIEFYGLDHFDGLMTRLNVRAK